MTTFALVFMLISMSLVTILTAYCLVRVLRSDVESSDEDSGATAGSSAASLPHD